MTALFPGLVQALCNEIKKIIKSIYLFSKSCRTLYITNLVCYTYFHWLLNPECQHIFGKQTGYICTFSVSLIWAPNTITRWLTKTEIFTLH